jgi:protein arginine kinase
MDFIKLFEKQSHWSKHSPNSDTVLTTIIRLIRNIYDIPFSHNQNRSHVDFIKTIINRFIIESGYSGLEFIDINSVDEVTRKYLLEKSIITTNMISGINSYVVLSKNEDFNVIINDDDHIKIQIIKPGFQPHEAYDLADVVDNRLNKYAVYAFSEDIGYITSSQFNVNPFQVSMVLHLPVLYHTKEIADVQKFAKINKFILKGLRSDGIKTFGSIFILANEILPCYTENKILEILDRTANKIIKMESDLRDDYFAENGDFLKDRIFRSFGLLKYARRMGYVEAMDCLSDIRLGVILSLVKNIELQKINEIMTNMQWSHLQRIAEKEFGSSGDGDIFRAVYLKDQLEWSSIHG